MRQSDIVTRVRTATGVSKAQADAAVREVFRAIREGVSRGEDVAILGFGSFRVRTRSERQGRNPVTGEAMVIPARKILAYRPSETVKAELNG